jgi:hypothetical protein
MHTIKLKIKDKIYDKLLLLLGKFDKSELEIITDDGDFDDQKRYLESELREMRSGKAQFIGLEDLDTRLDNILNEIDQIYPKEKK